MRDARKGEDITQLSKIVNVKWLLRHSYYFASAGLKSFNKTLLSAKRAKWTNRQTDQKKFQLALFLQNGVPRKRNARL